MVKITVQRLEKLLTTPSPHHKQYKKRFRVFLSLCDTLPGPHSSPGFTCLSSPVTDQRKAEQERVGTVSPHVINANLGGTNVFMVRVGWETQRPDVKNAVTHVYFSFVLQRGLNKCLTVQYLWFSYYKIKSIIWFYFISQLLSLFLPCSLSSHLPSLPSPFFFPPILWFIYLTISLKLLDTHPCSRPIKWWAK